MIKEFKKGYRVCDDKRCYSNKPLSKKMAEKQRIAIALSEHKKTGKPINSFFV
jgi:hypothetical protein